MIFANSTNCMFLRPDLNEFSEELERMINSAMAPLGYIPVVRVSDESGTIISSYRTNPLIRGEGFTGVLYQLPKKINFLVVQLPDECQ